MCGFSECVTSYTEQLAFAAAAAGCPSCCLLLPPVCPVSWAISARAAALFLLPLLRPLLLLLLFWSKCIIPLCVPIVFLHSLRFFPQFFLTFGNKTYLILISPAIQSLFVQHKRFLFLFSIIDKRKSTYPFRKSLMKIISSFFHIRSA